MLTLFVLAFCVLGCQSGSQSLDSRADSSLFLSINGKTMGTTYHVIYQDSLGLVIPAEIDSLLISVNQGVSTYISDSDISRLNQAKDQIFLPKKSQSSVPVVINGEINSEYIFDHLVDNYRASLDIHQLSNKLFDPTIMPLVNYWGFGYKGREPHTFTKSDTIDLILPCIGFENVVLDELSDSIIVRKNNPCTELDFSAIAKGYGVDLVKKYLQACGVTNAYVEIGGEVITMGQNSRNVNWTIGINTPEQHAQINDFEQIIAISGLALASSGNYRNYHTVEGVQYGHEINPLTGYPEQTDVLSASVLASTCQIADGLATACMVMGVDKSIKMIESMEGVEVLLVTANPNGKGFEQKKSSGFSRYELD